MPIPIPPIPAELRRSTVLSMPSIAAVNEPIRRAIESTASFKSPCMPFDSRAMRRSDSRWILGGSCNSEWAAAMDAQPVVAAACAVWSGVAPACVVGVGASPLSPTITIGCCCWDDGGAPSSVFGVAGVAAAAGVLAVTTLAASAATPSLLGLLCPPVLAGIGAAAIPIIPLPPARRAIRETNAAFSSRSRSASGSSTATITSSSATAAFSAAAAPPPPPTALAPLASAAVTAAVGSAAVGGGSAAVGASPSFAARFILSTSTRRKPDPPTDAT